YIFYSTDEGERNLLSRLDVSLEGDGISIDPESELVILEIPQSYPNHNGGKMAFGPDDGMLYVSLGDGGPAGDAEGNAQNLGTLKGSIIRIDVSAAREEEPYQVPGDNPFVDEPDALSE